MYTKPMVERFGTLRDVTQSDCTCPPSHSWWASGWEALDHPGLPAAGAQSHDQGVPVGRLSFFHPSFITSRVSVALLRYVL